MPVYRLSAQIIGRGAGKSAVAAAAYRAAERLVEAASAVASAAYRSGAALGDERASVEHDFRREARRGAQRDRASRRTRRSGWPTASGCGTRSRPPRSRKDAQLASEIQLALPRELDREAQIALVRGFVAEQFVARGMVADFAIHDVRARDGGRQPHAT